MLVCPASRAMLAAVLRNAAMSCGPAPSRILETSSRWVTSRTWWTLFSIAQWPLQPVGERGRVGGAVVQGGDRVDDLGRGPPGAVVPAPADDLDRPGGVREQRRGRDAVKVDDLDRARLGAAVSDLPAPLPGRLGPRQGGQRPTQGGLIALDGEQVVPAALAQPGGVLALAVQRVGGDNDLLQVRQGGQGGGERGDLVATDHRGLGEQQVLVVVVDAEDLDLRAGGAAGAAQRLAVGRNHAPLLGQ